MPSKSTVQDPRRDKVLVELDVEVGPGGEARIVAAKPADDGPLYIPVLAAAKRVGVSYEMMTAWANRAFDPIPHIQTGKKKLIRVDALKDFAMKMENTPR